MSPTVVPDAPTITEVVAGPNSVTVGFTAPANDGGGAITGYTVTAVDTVVTANGGQTVSGATSPITVTGLTDGDIYVCTVIAHNSAGDSVPSAPSLGVAPTLPPPPVGNHPPLPNAAAFTVTKEINMVQLIDELTAAVGQQVNMASVGAFNGGGSGAITLWIAPSTLNATQVETVLANHVADVNYGVPESTLAYQVIVDKVAANADVVLTDQERDAALKGVLLRLNALMRRG